MPGVDRECTTHHKACDCREAWYEAQVAVLRVLVGEKDEGLLALLEFYSDPLLATLPLLPSPSPKPPCGSVWRRSENGRAIIALRWRSFAE